MLAFLMPLLESLLGGLITPFVNAWTTYQTSKIKADTTIQVSQLNTEVENNALKVQLYGTPIYRFVTFMVGIPVSVHFAAVYIDTLLASHAFFGHSVIGVQKLPDPYNYFEWAIVSSFFLVHAVSKLGK